MMIAQLEAPAESVARVPVERIRSMLAYVDEMMYWPDPELTAQLHRLNALLPETGGAPDADRPAIEAVLKPLF